MLKTHYSEKNVRNVKYILWDINSLNFTARNQQFCYKLTILWKSELRDINWQDVSELFCPSSKMALCCRRVILLRADGIRLHEGPSRTVQVLNLILFWLFHLCRTNSPKKSILNESNSSAKAGILIWSFILPKVFHECFSNVCLSISNPLQQLFNCSLLYRLSLPDNDITVLPPAIANLTNLRELDVSKNSKQNGQFASFFLLFGVQLRFWTESEAYWYLYGLTEPSSTVIQFISSSSTFRISVYAATQNSPLIPVES